MNTRYEGSASLEELKRTIEDAQRMQVAKLVHLEGLVVQDKNYNYATYTFVTRRREVPDEIVFIQVVDESKVPSIIAEQIPNLLIFNEEIFIGEVKKKYLGFAKFNA